MSKEQIEVDEKHEHQVKIYLNKEYINVVEKNAFVLKSKDGTTIVVAKENMPIELQEFLIISTNLAGIVPSKRQGYSRIVSIDGIKLIKGFDKLKQLHTLKMMTKNTEIAKENYLIYVKPYLQKNGYNIVERECNPILTRTEIRKC